MGQRLFFTKNTVIIYSLVFLQQRAGTPPSHIDKKGLHAIPVDVSHICIYLVCSVTLLCVLYQGITTYDYVVAMRAMSEAAPEDEEGAIYSPTNSATTGFSMGSSLGLHHKGAWCTPPRIFIDQVSLFAFKGKYVAYKS
jgi:hypothetical protein